MKKIPPTGEEFPLSEEEQTPALGIVTKAVGLPPAPNEPRLISIDTFVRGGNHLYQAFRTTQMLIDQGHVKRTRAEWTELLNFWMRKSR